MSMMEILILVVLAAVVLLFTKWWMTKRDQKIKNLRESRKFPVGVDEGDEAEEISSLQQPPNNKHSNRQFEDNDPLFMTDKAKDQDPLFQDTDPLFDSAPLQVKSSVQSKNQLNSELSAKPNLAKSENIKSQEQTPNKSPSKPPQIIALYVLAKSGHAFMGYELLQALLAVNFRFGEMSAFHRHEHPNGDGKVLFSVVQATEPGIFNMDEIGALKCTGLTIFMQLTGPEHNAQAFELMLEAAQSLAEDLDGVLHDAKREILTPGKIGQYRDEVRLHELKQSTANV